jgi:hypothetical protein
MLNIQVTDAYLMIHEEIHVTGFRLQYVSGNFKKNVLVSDGCNACISVGFSKEATRK